jgi:hypothetical protein
VRFAEEDQMVDALAPMPQCRILCLKSALRLERRGEQGDEEA